jgi:probable selenium-dependent hydroxylase accessory protein YqeC
VFAKHFVFQAPAVVNFVGGGGKTGLILRLLDELADTTSAIYTTTTRMHPPDPGRALVILSADNIQLLKSVLNQIAASYHSPHTKFVAASLPIPDSHNLIGGVPADFVRGINRNYFSVILNEADGARSMSLKMPRAGEPVLMEEASYLVPVIGIDCLLKPLGPETLFRWEMAATRFSLKAGQTITPKLASELLLHKEGVCSGYRPGMTIVPFVNKVDDPKQDSLARELALALLHNENFPVGKVVWGSIYGSRVSSLSAVPQQA